VAAIGRPKPNESVYTIGVVERMTGLSARQIRYYETKGLITPERSNGNQRLYSRAQIETLKEVRALREEQLPLEAIAALLATDRREDGER